MCAKSFAGLELVLRVYTIYSLLLFIYLIKNNNVASGVVEEFVKDMVLKVKDKTAAPLLLSFPRGYRAFATCGCLDAVWRTGRRTLLITCTE